MIPKDIILRLTNSPTATIYYYMYTFWYYYSCPLVLLFFCFSFRFSETSSCKCDTVWWLVSFSRLLLLIMLSLAECMCDLVSFRYSFFICACSLSCYWIALLSASVFVVHVQTVLPYVMLMAATAVVVVVLLVDVQSVRRCVCQHFYIRLNFPFIFPRFFPLCLFLSPVFLSIEFHRVVRSLIQCVLRSRFFIGFVFFVVIVCRYVLSCIFCKCVCYYGLKALTEYGEMAKPRVVTETTGLLFSFSFNCLCCYILFIGNSFACLLFFICFGSIPFILVFLCVCSGFVSELESRKC